MCQILKCVHPFSCFSSGVSAKPAGHREGPKGPTRTRNDINVHKESPQDGSSWPPRRPRWPKMPSKMPPRRPRWPKMAYKFAQDGPRWPPRWPKRVQDASKSAQEATKTAQAGSRMAPDAPRRPMRPPRRPKKPPRGPPGRPETAKIIAFRYLFERFWYLLLFGLPTAQDGPRGPQDRPKSAQEASKMAP